MFSLHWIIHIRYYQFFDIYTCVMCYGLHESRGGLSLGIFYRGDAPGRGGGGKVRKFDMRWSMRAVISI